MTWTATIMPDDALPEDSLVGRLLKPPVADNDLARDLAKDAESLPLWRVMDDSYGTHDGFEESYANMIEALRDWLLPEAAKWYPHRELYALLTEQARIAREGK